MPCARQGEGVPKAGCAGSSTRGVSPWLSYDALQGKAWTNDCRSLLRWLDFLGWCIVAAATAVCQVYAEANALSGDRPSGPLALPQPEALRASLNRLLRGKKPALPPQEGRLRPPPQRRRHFLLAQSRWTLGFYPGGQPRVARTAATKLGLPPTANKCRNRWPGLARRK